jgi:hypothetical protein
VQHDSATDAGGKHANGLSHRKPLLPSAATQGVEFMQQATQALQGTYTANYNPTQAATRCLQWHTKVVHPAVESGTV